MTCAQKISLGPSRGVTMSEPTVGDVGRSHRVFVVVYNHQAKNQGTIVKARGTLYGISSIVLCDLGALDSFISPFLV